MKRAIYKNRRTNETYTLANIKNLEHAWKMFDFACSRMDWNPADICHIEVTVQRLWNDYK